MFLFGLATTIASNKSRWIFTGSGLAITCVAVIWAAVLFFQPVFDLRTQGKAIPHYAEGVGLAHQEKYEEAFQAFDASLLDYPGYANALAERANASFAIARYDEAIADYEKAIAAGDRRANTAGMLAYSYYLNGQFDKGADMDLQALNAGNSELWIQFDLRLNKLAAGKIIEATAIYEKAMTAAADEVLPVASDLMSRLKSLTFSLEYTSKAPAAKATAEIEPLAFAEPDQKDDEGEVTSYKEPADEFENGLKEIGVMFDYTGIRKGADVVFKLYINGDEDPSWRVIEKWALNESGSATIPISYAYSDSFSFQPGEYTVELYVDYNLVQRSSFVVKE